MAVDYGHLMSLESRANVYRYRDQETMLYALGVGMGRDPLDERELDFVFERGALRTLPSMASVLTNVPLLKDCGWDYSRVLHGEEGLVLHRPLPPAAELVADVRVVEAYDKGRDKGALIYTETTVRDAADDRALFTLTRSLFARGDGGFGGATGPSPKPHPVPARSPDASLVRQTRPDQALLYRLNGDRDPLHGDPALAKRVGFPVPILHGLCTCGIACTTLLEAACDYDHTRIAGREAGFSAPVYPCAAITTDLWCDGNVVSFECRVEERGVHVIRNGKCTLRD